MDSFLTQLKNTFFTWLWASWYVPLLGRVRPWILELNPDRVKVFIKLRRLTKNHVGSMYMGALVQGADLAAGLMVRAQGGTAYQSVTLIFKDIRGDFLKRAEGNTLFVCQDGEQVRQMLEEASRDSKRVNGTLNIEAFCPDIDSEPVAKFQLTISLGPKK